MFVTDNYQCYIHNSTQFVIEVLFATHRLPTREISSWVIARSYMLIVARIAEALYKENESVKNSH